MKINIVLGLIYLTVLFIFCLVFVGTCTADNDVNSNITPSIAPINPEYLKWLNRTSIASEDYPTGFVPPVVSLDHLKGKSVWKTSNLESIPDNYDLRDENRLTPVKNQGNFGTCWAFASLGSYESSLMPEQENDFSEKNVVNRNLWLTGPNTGGNYLKSGSYLLAWLGPVNESLDPYPTSNWNYNSPSGPVTSHLQNILYIPDRSSSTDLDTIKEQIISDGAVQSSFEWGDGSNYNSSFNSYYCPSCDKGDHAVDLVGWDDSFSRDNFTSIPGGDGAFLFRNSWGSNWGDGGYAWISYYDPLIGSNNAQFLKSGSSNYSGIYQYDPAGYSAAIGYSSTSIWGGNVFTAVSDSNLSAVGFYTLDIPVTYEIRIYKNPTTGGPVGSTILSQKTGTIDMSGYHTIDLDTQVNLKTGESFSIVLHITDSTYKSPLAIEYPGSGPVGNTWNASAGQGYISNNGNSWTDITKNYKNTSVCIKSYTIIPSPVASFTSNKTSGTVPLSIHFTDTSTNTPTSWSWQFGDSGISTVQHPVHTYTTAGKYTVNLTAGNAGGSNTKSTSDYITATNPVLPPVASFSSNKTSGTVPLSIHFTDTSTNTPTSWSWQFGDSGISTVQHPVHTYTTAGKYTVNLTAGNAGGSNTKSTPDYVTATNPVLPPVASFTSNKTSGTVPLSIQFTDTSTNTPTSWSWQFGDSGTSTVQHPVHMYTKAGKYTVNLTAGNAGGSNTKSTPDYVTATSSVLPPVASFTSNKTSGTVPLSIQFTDTSTNTPTSWSWQFGDSGTSTVQHPVHKYTVAGKYTVNLTTGNAGGSNTKSTPDYVTATSPVLPPRASFSSNKTSGTIPLSIQFTDTSTNTPTSWSWQFGDSGTSTVQHPVHTYTTAGKYTVNLTAGNAGGSNTKSTPDYVTATSPVLPPVASFTSNKTSGTVPLSIQFTDTSTNTPTSWSWQFGDSGTSTVQHPVHKYTVAGKYTVNLTAGNAGGSNTKSTSDYITATSPVLPPVASFSSNKTSGTVPLSIQFTDTSTNTPTSWSWQFGDSGISTVQYPVHTYTVAGKYTVNLTAGNAGGSNTKSTSDYSTATNPVLPPVASFSSNMTSGTVPLSIHFTDTSTNTPTSWSWQFGDSGISTVQHPVHTYTVAGKYTVNLTAGNAGGSNTKSTSDYITATSPVLPPVASFSSNKTSGTVPLSIHFTDTSTNTPTSWSWQFGDSGISTVQHPVHTYTTIGKYMVNLTAGNAGGSNTKSTSDYITATNPVLPPVASFSSNKTSGTVPLSIHFTDTSTNTPTSWSWQFGDSRTSTVQHPVHTYTKAGKYTVNLTAGNAGGSNTKSTSDYITATNPVLPPMASFSSNKTSGTVPLSIHFTDTSTNTPTSWSWQFGDSGTSTVQHPVHTYTKAGKYTVNLTAGNAGGSNTKSTSDYITATEKLTPTADFTFTPSTVNITEDVLFTAIVTGPDLEPLLWDFGDGSSSITGLNPVHKYELPEIYNVTLTVINPYGKAVSVHSVPVRGLIPDFEISPSGGWAVVNTSVKFSDASKGNPVEWLWDFGDGANRSTNQNVTTHIYTTAGNYTINMMATNWQPITESASPKQISILEKTVPREVDFDIPELKQTGSAPYSVEFEDVTPVQSNVTGWFWDFGDGSNSIEQAPNHTYATPGQYNVILTVRNDMGTNEVRKVAFIVVV